MINTLYNLVDWTSYNGVTEDSDTFKYNQPSLYFAGGSPSYAMKDLGRHHNDTIVTWYRSDVTADFTFRFLFGCTELGTGYAFEINWYNNVKLIKIVDFIETEVLIDNNSTIWFPADHWIEVKILIVNNKIQIFLADKVAIEYNEFAKVGDFIGLHNNNSITNINIGDTIWYDDQILWGNVNVNGANNQFGYVLLYDQFSIEYLQNTRTDTSGNWMLFLEEDPIQQTKHILVGGITSNDNLQPKGISSITL